VIIELVYAHFSSRQNLSVRKPSTIRCRVRAREREREKKWNEDDELNGSKLRKTFSSGNDLFSIDKEITVLSFLLLLIQWRARIIE